MSKFIIFFILLIGVQFSCSEIDQTPVKEENEQINNFQEKKLKDFNIVDYGAVPDGKTLNLSLIHI